MNKYPKRGGDCEYTMDCPWGVDGWCDRLPGSKCEIQKMDEAKAIEKEYAKALKQAGISPPRQRSDPTDINEFMARRVATEKCTCGGSLKQTRSGSFRAKCAECGRVWQLGGKKR